MKKVFHRLFQPVRKKQRAQQRAQQNEAGRLARGLNIFCRVFVLISLLNSLLAAWFGTNGATDEFDIRRLPISNSLVESTGRMRRPYGMPPWMFDSYIRACEKAGISPQRVLQTIGNAKASSGYHKQDGIAREQGSAYAYGAAVDLRSSDLSTTQKRTLLSALADANYFGWYRRPGQVGGSSQHFHVVFTGYPMKPELRQQFRRFLTDRAGLAGNPPETFWNASDAQKKRLTAQYIKRNSLRD